MSLAVTMTDEKVTCRRRHKDQKVVLPDGTREATPQGVPQGGPLSPLLANIVLDPLDKELERRGHRFAPHADDFLVMVRSAKAAQRVMEITRRNRGHRVQDVIDELRRYVTGWLHYFGISHTYTALLELEEWVRRRVRLYYWKQWKQPRTRRRHLLALGIPREEVHMATRSRKGYWRMSANSISTRPDQPMAT